MSKSRNSHIQKTPDQRKTYLSFISNDETAPKIDTSDTDKSTALLEEQDKTMPAKRKRAISWKVKTKRWLAGHITEILIAILISLMSYILVEHKKISNNLTKVSTKIGYLERYNDNYKNIVSEFEKIKFQVEKLWNSVFDSKTKKK